MCHIDNGLCGAPPTIAEHQMMLASPRRGLLSALDPINRRMGDVECVYVMDFFKMLWKGEI